MFDALKDLYISYPFMPVESAPELFAHIKDIRCVVELPAGNTISLVENDNYIRAWLVRMNSQYAWIEVQCAQYRYDETLKVPVYVLTAGAPATNSYVLIDSELVIPQDEEWGYELQPDTLVFMQEAPVIDIAVSGQTANRLTGQTIETAPSQNVSITNGNNGIIIYGAPGAGLGVYTSTPGCYASLVPSHLEGKGALSINGLYGYVRIDGAHPVAVKMDTEHMHINNKDIPLPNITLLIQNAEVTNEANS